MKFFFSFKNLKNEKAFIIPFAVIIITIALSISLGVTMILIKEVFFSRLSRDSALAYYAADTALECALSIDNAYLNSDGLGIFPYDSLPNHEASSTLAGSALDNTNYRTGIIDFTKIYCAVVPIFDNIKTGFSVNVNPYIDPYTNSGKSSTYKMTMGLGGGKTRCAVVTVNKTSVYRQIISRGYSNCNIGGPNTLERAVVNTTQY